MFSKGTRHTRWLRGACYPLPILQHYKSDHASQNNSNANSDNSIAEHTARQRTKCPTYQDARYRSLKIGGDHHSSKFRHACLLSVKPPVYVLLTGRIYVVGTRSLPCKGRDTAARQLQTQVRSHIISLPVKAHVYRTRIESLRHRINLIKTRHPIARCRHLGIDNFNCTFIEPHLAGTNKENTE